MGRAHSVLGSMMLVYITQASSDAHTIREALWQLLREFGAQPGAADRLAELGERADSLQAQLSLMQDAVSANYGADWANDEALLQRLEEARAQLAHRIKAQSA